VGTVLPYQNTGHGFHTLSNNGTFTILEVVDANTVKYYNGNAVYPDSNSGNIDWSLCTSPITSQVEMSFPGYPTLSQTYFQMDNTTIYASNYYNWSTIYVSLDWEFGRAGKFIDMKAGSYLDEYTITVDGNLVIRNSELDVQVIYNAGYGNGTAYLYAMPGMNTPESIWNNINTMYLNVGAVPFIQP
jgi:hypothetical protein